MSLGKRESAKASIIKVNKFVTSDDAKTATYEIVMTYYERLQEQWLRFQQFHDEIVEVTGEKDLAFQQIELNDVEDVVLKAVSIFKTLIVLLKPEDDDDSVKTYLEKLGLLKTNIDGDAGKLIKNLKLTSDQYAAAWKILNDRFENERVLVHRLQMQIYSLPVSNGRAEEIKKLLDETNQALTALTNQKRNIEYYNDWLVFLIEIKLDATSKARWEEYLEGKNDVPTWEQMEKFLTARFRSLEVAEVSEIGAAFSYSGTGSPNTSMPNVFHVQEKRSPCQCCSKTNHEVNTCFLFRKKSFKDRQSIVLKNRLCTLCLKPNHQSSKCSSNGICYHCNKRHHTLLHDKSKDSSVQKQSESKGKPKKAENRLELATSSSSSEGSLNKKSLHVGGSLINSEPVLLATAMISVRSEDGSLLLCRALIDQGSEVSFITAEAVRRLGLTKIPTPTYLHTVGSMRGQLVSKGFVLVNFDSHNNSILSLQIEALVIDKITGNLPSTAFDMNNQPFELEKLNLADPQYGQPRPVELLLGVEVYTEIISNGIKKLSNGLLAQNSTLGWIVSGRTSKNPKVVKSKIVVHHCGLCNLEIQLRTFWELEEIVADKSISMTPEELLGSSRKIAVSCFLRLEKRFAKSPEMFGIYSGIMQELIQMNHMELVPVEELSISPEKSFYLPHHVVVNPSSTTTRYRVVFNASQKTTSGLSLNDVLLTGPSLYNDLFHILLHFRFFKYAFIADLSKMYRQILVDKTDCDYQRLVWRNSPSEPLRDYRLLTVSFGTSSAPYLALKTIRTLAETERDRYPLASTVILRDMYMDDVTSGTHDIEQLLSTKDQLLELFKSAGLELKKWCSNSDQLLDSLPLNYRENLMLFGDAKLARALGIYWNLETDEFRFRVNLPEQKLAITKRILLSEASSLFDPLGWAAPCIVVAKIIFQSLWKNDLQWDEPLPDDLCEVWVDFRQSLPILENISIPRWTGTNPVDLFTEIHGFCDGSEKAYSSVIYLRVKKPDGSIGVTLLTAKTKVAPVKQISVPRLELCAALLLARLMVKVQKALDLTSYTVHSWSDSMVVLAYLRKLPCHWSTFVANRTSEILDSISSDKWHYVNTKQNPADCASRGLHPNHLQSHSLWWTGPDWLHGENINYPTIDSDDGQLVLERRKSTKFVGLVQINGLDPFRTRYSSLTKLIRMTAWWLRYVENCRTLKGNRTDGYLKVFELENALQYWIKVVQCEHFASEMVSLEDGDDLPRDSRLLSLNPFLDPKGILRVGGRLTHSELSEERKHPIILPKDDHFTRLLVEDTHLRTLHGNIQLLLNTLRMKYWILDARNLVKSAIFRCMRCYRLRPKSLTQVMGDFPSYRVTVSSPFTRSGVDYAGPIYIKRNSGRGNVPLVKGYISIFVCMVTKAVHLEAVTSLDTPSFIAAFKRFIGRRGLVSDIYSDNGTNFVGASGELDRLHEAAIIEMEESFAHALVLDGVQWHFNPPSGPHFGGIYEAAVRSMKYHLRRIFGNSHYTYEELSTALAQIEAALNSRPLCPITDNPEDYNVLTPGHFLIGRELIANPEPSLVDVNENRLDRWQRTQQSFQHFWKRWSVEYLGLMQQRPKWRYPQEDLEIGELVIVHEPNTPPLTWPLARVVDVHPGSDGEVRVVSIKMKKGHIYQRPIVKLSRLPFHVDTLV